MKLYPVFLGTCMIVTCSLYATLENSAPKKTGDTHKLVKKNVNVQLPSTQPSEKIETRPISLKSRINADMITYKKFPAPYPVAPSLFTVTINQDKLEENQELNTNATKDTLAIAYECEFKKWGILYHREHHLVTFSLPKNQKSFEVAFNWESPFRLAIAGAKPIRSINLDARRKKNHAS